MLTRDKKTVLFCVLVLAGISLLIYGFGFHTISVLKGPAIDQMPTFADQALKKENTLLVPETDVVRDVTQGGVVHWPSGDIQRTYSIDKSGSKVDATGKKLPQTCPT